MLPKESDTKLDTNVIVNKNNPQRLNEIELNYLVKNINFVP